MLQLSELNWLGIIVSLVINTVLGGIWFTVLFGKKYADTLGREYDPSEKPGLLFILGPMVCGAVMIIAMNLIASGLDIKTLKDAIYFGLIVGFGLVASTSINTAINPNIPRPLYYGFISGSFFVVTVTIISIILFLL